MVKTLPAMQETRVRSLGEDPLKKEMATHSSILAWEITMTEGPGRLLSMGYKRVRQCLATKKQTNKQTKKKIYIYIYAHTHIYN